MIKGWNFDSGNFRPLSSEQIKYERIFFSGTLVTTHKIIRPNKPEDNLTFYMLLSYAYNVLSTNIVLRNLFLNIFVVKIVSPQSLNKTRTVLLAH